MEAAGPDGVLLVGGSLAPDWRLEAYRRGIFPMPIRVAGRRLVAWLSPDPRGILPLDGLHISRRLRRRMRRGEFQFTFDRRFADVVRGCAARRGGPSERWLTFPMETAYRTLHKLGHAHSVEAWQDGRLVGGAFGVTIGGLFAGESMFHRVTDASKAALAFLVEHLVSRRFALLDVQWTSGHTRSLGAIDIARGEYLERLATAVEMNVSFDPPRVAPGSASQPH